MLAASAGMTTYHSEGLSVMRIPQEQEVLSVAEVRVNDGESIESALRRFKRRVQQEDIIKDIKKHTFYLKPGERKRIKSALARKRNRKKIRREYD
jgi:small subunit ribosomal protein S21